MVTISPGDTGPERKLAPFTTELGAGKSCVTLAVMVTVTGAPEEGVMVLDLTRDLDTDPRERAV